MKILVVDDEKMLVKGIKFNLENEGYEVEPCYDGAAAVEQARTGEYDLIILDLMMPQTDGLTAIRRLREKLEPNPAQPEYILTKWGVGYYFVD